MYWPLDQQYTLCLNVFFVKYQYDQEKHRSIDGQILELDLKTCTGQNRSQTWWPAATTELEL